MASTYVMIVCAETHKRCRGMTPAWLAPTHQQSTGSAGPPAEMDDMTTTTDGTRREMRSDIGQRIREWRLRREMSQADVARHAGITQASLSNYENGKRDMPLSTLIGVAGALNVSLGDLLDLPEVIVVRDSLLGRAVEQLQTRVPVGAAEAAF